MLPGDAHLSTFCEHELRISHCRFQRLDLLRIPEAGPDDHLSAEGLPLGSLKSSLHGSKADFGQRVDHTVRLYLFAAEASLTYSPTQLDGW